MRSISIRRYSSIVLCLLTAGSLRGARAQSLGNTGTVTGTVMDASGAAIPKASVRLHSPLTNYTQSVTSAEDGSFRLVNIPPNPYHLEVAAPGFAPFGQDLDVRNSLPLQLKATLAVAGSQETITVEATGADLLEVNPS